MALGPEETLLEEHEEGGPTKSFLEHLEDLRWVLMKCISAIGIGFLVCLLAAPQLVQILKWPLLRSELNNPGKHPTLTLRVGTNTIGTYNLSTNQAALFGTNIHRVFDLVPKPNGNTFDLVFQEAPDTDQGRADRISLRNFGPASAFFIAVQIAIYGGILLASPFLVYFLCQFIFPALKIKEKKYGFRGLIIGTGLFLTGVCFCYFFLMPIALSASVRYSEWMGFRADEWRAEDYISFLCKFMLGMGLGFELPVVILILVKIGLLNYRQLAAFRRYMIVINLILGAVLTTPEVITQVCMAIPLQLLYEVSVWIAWYWEWKARREERTKL